MMRSIYTWRGMSSAAGVWYFLYRGTPFGLSSTCNTFCTKPLPWTNAFCSDIERIFSDLVDADVWPITKLEYATSSLWVVVYHVSRVALFQISLRFPSCPRFAETHQISIVRDNAVSPYRQAGKAFANLNGGVCNPKFCPDVIGIVCSIWHARKRHLFVSLTSPLLFVTHTSSSSVSPESNFDTSGQSCHYQRCHYYFETDLLV